MKKDFIEIVEKLFSENPTVVTQEAQDYLNALKAVKEVKKPELSDGAKNILAFMKDNNIPMPARDIANGMGISSRCVSGSMRKLVELGYVETISENPKVYIKTNKEYVEEKGEN